MALLAVENLSFTYPGVEKKALDGIDFRAESGEFLLLCGASGCGKTTLLRLLKRELAPRGTVQGSVRFDGVPQASLDPRASAADIGFVAQDPDAAIVTDKVYHELAFGLESLGEPRDVIRRRVAEISGFFGIGAWYRRDTASLSGGQKQLLQLAAALVMRPRLLLLDEPTAQLDPIAAGGFLSALQRVRDELGVTVLLVEHRLEEVFPLADRVIFMEEGRVVFDAPPRKIGAWLGHAGPAASAARDPEPLPVVHDDPESPLAARASAPPAASQPISDAAAPVPFRCAALGLPSAVRLFAALGGEGECPLTVREGKRYIETHFRRDVPALALPVPSLSPEVALEVKDGWFRYARELPDVLRGLALTVHTGELLCVLGANGAGKTTLLRVLSGTRRLYRGSYHLFGRRLRGYAGASLYRGNLAMLPQNPRTLFLKDTLREDLAEAARLFSLKKDEVAREIETLCGRLGIAHLCARHPYDLSGGEQQKAALAKLLLAHPRVLLLDEPTKGLDAASKATLGGFLADWKREGKTVVVVTHDIEFAAAHADRVALFFDGQIVSEADPVSFFSENRYYTTAASRMTRPFFSDTVTVEQAAALCRVNGALPEVCP